MYSETEQIILFQTPVSDWRSSFMWDQCLPREPKSPLFLVREFIRAIKIEEGLSE